MSKPPYNILNICSWYPNELKPTLGNFVQKHAEVISQQNQNTVLAIFPHEGIKELKIEVETRETLKEIIIYYPKKTNGNRFLSRIKNYNQHRKAFLTGYRMVIKEFGKPDLVHLNIVYPLGIWALWLKFRFGIPYVVTENSSGFHMNSTHKYPRKVLRLCKWILRKSNYLLPVSDNLKENLKLLAPKNKYSLISNVVDENLFQPTKKNNTNEVRRLIHISTGVDEIKNLSGMIRVMKNLQTENFPVSLDIVSDGNIEYAKDLSKELDLDLSVFFHSTKTTNEIAEMISQSDALLMFSNYENFPCVIAESMMSGKPVIATNVNGIPEHVLKDNGILVEPRNEDQLGNAIKKFLNNELKFDGRKIRQYALHHFSYTSVSNQFQEIYNEILIKK